MANCKTFLDKSDYEKSMYLGMLIHCAMSDESILKMGQDLIDLGIQKGLFDSVKIMPDHNKPDLSTNNTE